MGTKNRAKTGHAIVKKAVMISAQATAASGENSAARAAFLTPSPSGTSWIGTTPRHAQMAAAVRTSRKPGRRVRTTPLSSARASAVLTMATVVVVSMPETRKTLIATMTKVSADTSGMLVRMPLRTVSDSVFVGSGVGVAAITLG
jgi:hypothetical protein